MRQVYLSPRVPLPHERPAESSVRRVGHAHTRIRRADGARASREGAAENTVGPAGLRLPDAQTHLAPTEGEGWSGEERLAEPGGRRGSITGTGEGGAGGEERAAE